MATDRRVWTYTPGRGGKKPSVADKAAVTAACERLISEVLRPRFLPEIRPTARHNYPIAIQGEWLGHRYRLFTRYRSDDPNSTATEFKAPFARLDYVARDRFNLMWHRHTGQWHQVGTGLSLAEALDSIANDPFFHPC